MNFGFRVLFTSIPSRIFISSLQLSILHQFRIITLCIKKKHKHMLTGIGSALESLESAASYGAFADAIVSAITMRKKTGSSSLRAASGDA